MASNEYYAGHPEYREKSKARTKRWRENNREQKHDYNLEYTSKNRERAREWSRKNWHAIKMRALETLGSKCVRCGFSDWRALQINHKNGGGVKEHRNRNSQDIYKDVIAGIRDDLELLCANCNWIHRFENNLHSYNQPNRKDV